MSISITTADVKRKAMIATADTTHDSSISSLITETQPVIEHSIASTYLADTSDSGLQATLKLGILEIITGEFLEQLARAEGALEQFGVAGLTVGESKRRGVDLIRQGAARLDPYLKSRLPMIAESGSASTTVDCETTFGLEEEVW